jgi:hypothetical protein
MDRFTILANRLKEAILAAKLASQPIPVADKPPTPQEPET